MQLIQEGSGPIVNIATQVLAAANKMELGNARLNNELLAEQAPKIVKTAKRGDVLKFFRAQVEYLLEALNVERTLRDLTIERVNSEEWQTAQQTAAFYQMYQVLLAQRIGPDFIKDLETARDADVPAVVVVDQRRVPTLIAELTKTPVKARDRDEKRS